MSQVLRASAPPPGPWSVGVAAGPGVEPRAIGVDAGDAADAEFAATYGALEACRVAGLR
jgi:hypothetical protein